MAGWGGFILVISNDDLALYRVGALPFFVGFPVCWGVFSLLGGFPFAGGFFFCATVRGWSICNRGGNRVKGVLKVFFVTVFLFFFFPGSQHVMFCASLGLRMPLY